MDENKGMKKLKKILRLEGEIKVITGLKIGGSNESSEIGGIDNPVIKTNLYSDGNMLIPYIPGSSIKGRMRSLLELKNGENDLIKRVFGHEKLDEYTRVLFEDAYPTEDTINKWKILMNKGLTFDLGTESKFENKIDRKTGKSTGGLRQNERVIPGSTFKFRIKLLIFENDDEEEMKNLIEEGLGLLEKTYLGGSGSRGYGRIKIILNKDWEKEEL